MKRITSTLFVAALPALGMSVLGALSGGSASPAPQASRRPGASLQDGRGAAGPGETEEDDEAPRPGGFDPKSRQGFDVFGRRSRVRSNTFEERLQGGWRLVSMNLAGSSPRGRVAQGFLSIGPSFLSMEIHALWEDQGGSAIPENDVHTTFTAEYQVDSSGKLFCSTIIGSFIDEATGELRWERTGFEREYRVREIRQQIELTFDEGTIGQSRLVFEQYLPRTGGRRDIFGRTQMGSYGATDIFGRNKAAEQGERDIYGRPATAPPAGAGPAGKKSNGPRLPPKGPGAGAAPLSGRGGY